MSRSVVMRRLVLAVCSVAVAGCLTAPAAGAWSPRHSAAVGAKTRVLSVGDHLVGYRTFGRGSPIVFVPGYAVSMDYWDPVVLDLLARHYRIVLYDLRGVGRSTGTLENMSIKTLGDDLAAFIRRLRLRDVTVIGHSMGGDIAQQFAVDHPHELSHLALAATTASGGHFVPADPAALRSLVPPFDPFKVNDWSFTTHALDRAYLRRVFSRSHVERVPAAVQRAQFPLGGLWALAGAWNAQASMRTPTLVTVGNDDPLTPAANGERLAAHIPGAKLARFAGRHLFWAEHAARFTNLLDRFIRTTSH